MESIGFNPGNPAAMPFGHDDGFTNVALDNIDPFVRTPLRTPSPKPRSLTESPQETWHSAQDNGKGRAPSPQALSRSQHSVSDRSVTSSLSSTKLLKLLDGSQRFAELSSYHETPPSMSRRELLLEQLQLQQFAARQQHHTRSTEAASARSARGGADQMGDEIRDSLSDIRRKGSFQLGLFVGGISYLCTSPYLHSSEPVSLLEPVSLVTETIVILANLALSVAVGEAAYKYCLPADNRMDEFADGADRV